MGWVGCNGEARPGESKSKRNRCDKTAKEICYAASACVCVCVFIYFYFVFLCAGQYNDTPHGQSIQFIMVRFGPFGFFFCLEWHET